MRRRVGTNLKDKASKCFTSCKQLELCTCPPQARRSLVCEQQSQTTGGDILGI